MSIYACMFIICGSVLFLGFCVLLYYLAKFETEIKIALIKSKRERERTKIKNSTIFAWIFVLSIFSIIWIPVYRTQLIGTAIISFIFSYLALKGEKNKNE